jgi:biopolymer transport protein ExbD
VFESRRKQRKIQIDMSPLIDIVFLLLIFFAVSTTFLESSGLELELPQAQTGTAQEVLDLTVWIDAEGTIRFDGSDVELEQLHDDLVPMLAEDERKFVIVQADKNTRLERVVEVMDVARRAGARGLTIASEPQ